MKIKKTDYIALLILIASFVQLIVVYPTLPQQVVTNWGFNGQVDYGSKSTLWILWGISALMLPLFFIIPKIDPKGKSYEKVDGFYGIFRLVIVLFMTGMLEITILSVNDPHRFNVGKIVMIAASLLFIFIGNYLPKCKQTYTMGIKNMWTYADERVWNETHRFGGKLFAAAGVVMLLSALFASENIMAAVTIVMLLGCLVVINVYSYLRYRKYSNGSEE